MNDRATVEDRLRRTYRAVADTTGVSSARMPDLTETGTTGDLTAVDLGELRLPHHQRAIVRRFSFRHAVLVAAALATITALGVVRAVGTDGVDRAGTADLPPGWRELAEPPIEVRQATSTVWTGSEMLMFGGFSGNADTGVPGDGAAA
jgi:hypothetical protein